MWGNVENGKIKQNKDFEMLERKKHKEFTRNEMSHARDFWARTLEFMFIVGICNDWIVYS